MGGYLSRNYFSRPAKPETDLIEELSKSLGISPDADEQTISKKFDELLEASQQPLAVVPKNPCELHLKRVKVCLRYHHGELMHCHDEMNDYEKCVFRFQAARVSTQRQQAEAEAEKAALRKLEKSEPKTPSRYEQLKNWCSGLFSK